MTVSPPTLLNADLVINASEINDRHGVGILLQRIFKDSSNIITLRAFNLYGGDNALGVYDSLLGVGRSREEIFDLVRDALIGHKVNRILCIPYHVEEVFAALAVRELFGAEICTYLMDDQNVLTTGISDEAMGELLTKSRLILAISPEMRDIYTTKYGVDIYFAPPVIPAALVNTESPVMPTADRERSIGTIFGNVWSPKWLELLRTMTREAKVKLDWYGNTGADWNFRDREALTVDGIIERGFLPTEAEVAEVLRRHAYIVVPSGTLDWRDDNKATSWMSLPSRIPFAIVTANIPVIVLGSRSTAAARFVERFGIGVVADYDPASFQSAVAYITQPEIQQQFRQNAAQLAQGLVNEEMDEWIWKSFALGRAIDRRFEDLLANKLEDRLALTTALSIIRDREAEIQQLQANISKISSPVEYLKHNSQRWGRLRRVWLRLKGQL
jgi:hypothetical protein